LLYVKGGFAWANNRMSVSVVAPAFTASESKTHTGWTIGAGIEYMFAPNWSAKAEYMYADYGSERYAGVVDVGATVHTIKAGINYHFNWGAPVVARY
jgi:outer membrane immunogenic protein